MFVKRSIDGTKSGWSRETSDAPLLGQAGLLVCVLFAAMFAGCRYNPREMADSLMREHVDMLVDSLVVSASADMPSAPGAESGDRSNVVFGIYASDPKTGWSYARNEDRLFHAASTMKVPVMIEVFRQAGAGRFSLDDSVIVANAFSSIVDGSPYAMDISEDSDESIYNQIGKRMTIRELVEQMITVSSNLATNILIDMVTADSVQATAARLGIEHMRVLRGVEDIKAYEAGLSNTATAQDLGRIMERLAARDAVSAEADEEMIRILLRQQFNTMIPAGLPEGTPVAHKTGSITRINHDAAIVSPDKDPWVLVILAEGIDDHGDSSRMGSEIARAIGQIVRSGAGGSGARGAR